MLEKKKVEEEEKEKQEDDLEEDFNDLVKQLLWRLPSCKTIYGCEKKTLEWRWKENLGCAPLVFITFPRSRNWFGQKFWLFTGYIESYFSTFDNNFNKALVLSDLAQLLAHITFQLADWGNCLKCASRVQNVMEFPQGAATAVLRMEMRFYQKQVIDKCWFVYFKVLYLPGANLPPGGWDGLGEMEVPALNTAPLFHMQKLFPIHEFWLPCFFSLNVIGATLDSVNQRMLLGYNVQNVQKCQQVVDCKFML